MGWCSGACGRSRRGAGSLLHQPANANERHVGVVKEAIKGGPVAGRRGGSGTNVGRHGGSGGLPAGGGRLVERPDPAQQRGQRLVQVPRVHRRRAAPAAAVAAVVVMVAIGGGGARVAGEPRHVGRNGSGGGVVPRKLDS